MIAETENHGGREQGVEDNALVIDVHNGTDEHAMMSVDADNGGDAMDIADESPCCVENKESSDGGVLGTTSNGNGTEATTDMKTTVGIATGNWGCGAFGGNLELKSLLQWLAASQAGRPYMLYFSFQDPRAKRLQEVADWILQEQWCVCELWSILSEYGEQGQFHVNLFDWIMPHPGTKLHSSQHYHKAG